MSVDVGILTLGRPENRMESGDDTRIVLAEANLGNALRGEGFDVVCGGDPYPAEDKVATSSSMMRRHCHTLVDFTPASVVINITPGVRGGDLLATVRYLERELNGPPRLTLFTDATFTSSHSGFDILSASSALSRVGCEHEVLVARPEDDAWLPRLAARVRFHVSRAQSVAKVIDALQRLKRQKILLVGGGPSRETAELPDPDRLFDIFGVTLEAVPLAAWELNTERIAGRDPLKSDDPRIQAALKLAPRTDDLSSFAASACACLALDDLARSHEAGAVAVESPVNRRPESHDPDHSPSPASVLSASIDLAGRPKDIIPVARFSDVMGALTQLVCVLLTGEPSAHAVADDFSESDAGFGAFVHGLATEGGPATLARIQASRGGIEVDVHEATVSTVDGELRTSIAGTDLSDLWGSPYAALSAGHHAATLAEFTARLNAGAMFRIV